MCDVSIQRGFGQLGTPFSTRREQWRCGLHSPKKIIFLVLKQCSICSFLKGVEQYCLKKKNGVKDQKQIGCTMLHGHHISGQGHMVCSCSSVVLFAQFVLCSLLKKSLVTGEIFIPLSQCLYLSWLNRVNMCQ